ncbi:hypothetical protein P9112_005171 [Eukaryota sp. TZLM1-RC]
MNRLNDLVDDPTHPYVLLVPSLNLTTLSFPSFFGSLSHVQCSHNLISSLSPFSLCKSISYLDVSHNHLSRIPNASFWSSFTLLEVLFLNHNKLTSFSMMSALCHLTSLKILRLDGNPLTKSSSYRHYIVNSIPSLTCLDHHVVSDSEVINGLAWSITLPKWQPMSNASQISYFKPPITRDILDWSYYTSLLLKKVFQIQLEVSPVLLLQRVIRGFLVRKRISFVFLLKSAAVLEIQRVVRGFLVRQWVKRKVKKEVIGQNDDVPSHNVLKNQEEAARIIWQFWLLYKQKRLKKLIEQSDESDQNLNFLDQSTQHNKNFPLTSRAHRRVHTEQAVKHSPPDAPFSENFDLSQLGFICLHKGKVTHVSPDCVQSSPNSLLEGQNDDVMGQRDDVIQSRALPIRNVELRQILEKEAQELGKIGKLERIHIEEELSRQEGIKSRNFEGVRQQNVTKSVKFNDSDLWKYHCLPRRTGQKELTTHVKQKYEHVTNLKKQQCQSQRKEESKRKVKIKKHFDTRRQTIRAQFDSKFDPDSIYNQSAQSNSQHNRQKVNQLRNQARASLEKRKRGQSSLIDFTSGHVKVSHQLSRLTSKAMKISQQEAAQNFRLEMSQKFDEKRSVLEEQNRSKFEREAQKTNEWFRDHKQKLKKAQLTRQQSVEHKREFIFNCRKERRRLLEQYFQEQWSLLS